MNIAHQVLMAVLVHKDYRKFARIQIKWLDKSEVSMYNFIKEYYIENNEMPGIKSFCKMYGLDHTSADSRPTAYVKLLKERFVFSELAENIPTLLKSLKKDPMDSLDKIKDIVINVTHSVEGYNSRDSLYSDGKEQRLNNLLLKIENEGITYLSMGDEILDSLFFGYHKGELTTLGGRSGSKKTWLICYLAILLDKVLQKIDPDAEEFGDILFVSNEMSEEALKERMDCINFKIPFTDFISGDISPAQVRKYSKGLDSIEDSRIRIIYNCTTLDELEAKIKMYNPCKVFIDGSYLLEPDQEETWQKIVFITRRLKQLAKNNNLPIFNTTQLGKGKGTKKVSSFEAQDQFAFSNSYNQDSDLSMTTYMTQEMAYHSLVGITIAKGRNIAPNTEVVFRCPLGNMDLGFERPDELSESDSTTVTGY